MNPSKDILKTSKKKYQVKNWSEYTDGLKKRGSIDVYIDQDVVNNWKGQGRYTYNDQLITIILTLGQVYRKPLRQLEGFFTSLCKHLSLSVQTPNYTTLSRRNKRLGLQVQTDPLKESVTLIIDSTGVKVYGEGEWKVRKHGFDYRRTWIKAHLGIDIDGEIRTFEMTHSSAHDSPTGESLITQETKPIQAFYADGAYDSFDIYSLLKAKDVCNVYIPPKKNAIIRQTNYFSARDSNVRYIQTHSLKEWKEVSGYHKRSLVENTMFRLKKSFDGRLYFRTRSSQRNELVIQVNLLNLWRRLSYPEYFVS